MDNYIRVYENILSPQKCRHYINLIENSAKSIGGFIDKDGHCIINEEVKISEDVNFSLSFPQETEELLQIICGIVSQYEKDTNNPLIIQSCEHLVGRVYRKRKGHYNQHIDSASGKTIGRCLSVLLYLNNVNEGGELIFSNQDLTIEAREGRVVVFPSYWMYKHGAQIPLDVDRYIIRTFMSSLKL